MALPITLPLAFDGLCWFVVRPLLWWRPLAANALASVALLLCAVLSAWACWPAGELAWYHWLWRIPLALGVGMAAGIIAWSVVRPLLLAFVFDAIARAALRDRGIEPAEEPTARALPSLLVVLGGTIGLRLRWTVVALVSGLLGPPGILLAAYALARVAVVDALDTALAQRALPGAERLAIIRANGPGLRLAALSAAGLQLLLALTLVGWLLWMPALVAGAARHPAVGQRNPGNDDG